MIVDGIRALGSFDMDKSFIRLARIFGATGRIAGTFGRTFGRSSGRTQGVKTDLAADRTDDGLG